MTISSEVTSVTYPGNGTNYTWAYNFLIPSNTARVAQLSVVVESAAGVVTFIPANQFTIAGVDNPSGGTVTYPLNGPEEPALPLGSKISILRGQPYTQLTAVSNQAFYPQTIEEVADILTMQTQQLAEKSLRIMQVPPGDLIKTFIPVVALRKNKVLGFDSLGQILMYESGGGDGPGGTTAWGGITGIPIAISALEPLVPSAGKIIEYTGPGTARLIDTPSGAVNSVNGQIGTVVLTAAGIGAAPTVHNHSASQITDFGYGVNLSLLAGTGITMSYASGITTLNATGGGGGGMQPQLMSVFGAIDGGGVNTANNDAAISAAEAAGDTAFYWPEGKFKTTKLVSDLTKGYTGRGRLLSGATLLPTRYSYAAVKPNPAGQGTGETGWFSGDTKFSDSGEWKVIGPNVRTYDLALQYYQPTLLPHHAWFDSYSGSSGNQAYMTSGASAGAITVAVRGAPSSEWVGKQCTINRGFGGAVAETLTVASVNLPGKTVTFTTPLVNSYTWNPAAGVNSQPNITFAPRSWNGHTYVRVRALAGGDTYGHIIRTNMEYVPKNTELVHTFMTGTVGQYGGDTNFGLGSDGTYATALEFAGYDQNRDVAYISYVSSFIRDNDRGGIGLAFTPGGTDYYGGGRVWIGTRFQSAGAGYSDVAHNVAGRWRVAIDTVQAFLGESTMLKDPANAGALNLALYSENGAVAGQVVTVTNGASTYTGTVVTTATGTIITITPGLNASYPAGSRVEFPKGGAIINAAAGQKIIWNSTAVNDQNAYRGSDPSGVFGPFFGNKHGDIETGTETDANGEHWFTRFTGKGHSGSIARMRLFPTDLRVNVKIQSGSEVVAGKELVSNGYTVNSDFSGCLILGVGNELRFRKSTNKFEFVRSGVVIATIP